MFKAKDLKVRKFEMSNFAALCGYLIEAVLHVRKILCVYQIKTRFAQQLGGVEPKDVGHPENIKK